MSDPTPVVTWKQTCLADVVERHQEISRDPASDGFTRFLKVEHMDRDRLRLSRWGLLEEEEIPPTFYNVFRKGHVLFPSRNPHLRRVVRPTFDGICGEKTFVLKARDGLLQEFLPFIMQSDALVKHAVRMKIGSTNPHVRWRDLASFELALPPLDEQQRIVAALKAATDVCEAHLRSMSLAEILLRSAVDSAAEKAVAQQSVERLAALVNPDRPICYGILMPGTGFEGGVPVVKVKDYPEGDVVTDGLLLTDPKIDAEYERSRLRAGDLLISIRGTIGRLAFVPKALEGANITQDTARLSFRPEHESRYLRAMLESTFVQRQIASFITGLAVKGINIGELRRIQIPMVSAEEQQEVVKEVIAIRAAIKSIQGRLDRIDTFRRAVLAECLGGKK